MFTVSIRKDIYKGFFFPAPILLEKRLKDMLEDEVDEKYYLSDESVSKITFKTPDTSYCIDANYSKGSSLEQSIKKGRRQMVSQPKCKQVAQLYGFGKEPNPQAGRVYDANGISPTMDTMRGGNREPKIVASRGRGEPPKQHFEARKDNLTNTITSVQKDNYVATPKDKKRH